MIVNQINSKLIHSNINYGYFGYRQIQLMFIGLIVQQVDYNWKLMAYLRINFQRYYICLIKCIWKSSI